MAVAVSTSRDDIRVRIAGDLADINKSLRDLRKQTGAAGKAARQSRRDWRALGSGLDNVRRNVIGTVAGFVGIRALFQQTGQALRDLEEIERQARSLGASAEGIQELTFTFAEFQLESNDVADALGTISDRARDAQDGMQSFIDDFRLLGIEVDDLRGKRPDELFRLIAERVSRIEDPTARIAGIVRIFGDDLGRRLSPALLGGTELLDEFAEKARDAGAVLSDDLVRGGADAAAEVRRLQATLSAKFTREVAKNAEAIERLAAGMVDLGTATANFLSESGQGLGIILGRLQTGISDPNDLLGSLNEQIAEAEERLANITSPAFLASIGSRSRFDELAEEARLLRIRLGELRKSEQELRRNAGSFDFVRPDAPEEPESEVTTTVRVDARPALNRLRADLDAAGVLLSDEVKRLGAELDREFEDNLVRFADYYRRRAELETRAIDQQLAQQGAALSLVQEEIRLAQESGNATEEEFAKRSKLIAEITALERQRATVAAAAARDQAAAEQELADQLDQVRIRLLQAQGQTAEARTAEIENEFRDLLQRLKVEGDTEGTALVQKLFDVEVARARLEEIETEYSRSLSNLSREEQRVQALIDTGTISEREGRRRIIDLHQETADEVEQLIPLMRQLAEATGDPAAIERIRDLELELETLRSTVDTTIREMQEVIRDSGENAFSSFISGAQSARDAWDNFVDNVRQRAADLLSEGIFDRIADLLRGAGGGGGAIGQIAGFLAGVFHEGGIAGSATRMRRVPQLAFAGAPRYHTGGLVPGEVPAILKRGEEVLNPRDPRHRNNMGRGRVTVNIAARDAESFRRESPGQLGSRIGFMIQRARNRNS